MTTAVIIVAAGRGNRAGGEIAKQWQMLGGRPVLAHGLAAFANLPVVLVIHPEDRARAAALAPGVRLIDGGASRGESVR
ncbi:MAG: 2-C-methyl-D-erythritol 4-phosphate cytidylyltransferase, partial [Paracoccaceae bacterium]